MRKVLFEDLDNDPEAGASMEFRLTYEGPLLSIQRDPVQGQPIPSGQRDNKYAIRRALHFQLRDLWQTVIDRPDRPQRPTLLVANGGPDIEHYSAEGLARQYSMFGFQFVPLVTKSLDLVCGLDVLLLRADRPGDVVWRGDIDNRIKMLIDALRLPEGNERYSDRTPDSEETPTFCLLEDDRLVTKLVIDTDQLLSPNDPNHVKLVITVRLRPFDPHIGNLWFL